MEQDNLETKELKQEKPVYMQLALPVSILVAALLISGSLFYTRGSGTANIAKNTEGQTVELKLTSEDHVLGDPKAKITIVEFADFRCPFCERFYTQSELQIIKDYVDTGKARFVFKNFAFLGSQSVWASEATECAGEQGKYWEYYNWLFANQAAESNLDYYSKANLIKYAAKFGIGNEQFATCLNTDKYAKRVSDDQELGKSIGISGTPSLVIMGKDNKFDIDYIGTKLAQKSYIINLPNGNYFIVGAQPYSALKTALDEALKK